MPDCTFITAYHYDLYYTARATFDNNDDTWSSYFEWIKLPQLREVASLDTALNQDIYK